MSYLPGGEGLFRVAGWKMDERTVQERLVGTQGKSYHAGKDRDTKRMEVGNPQSADEKNNKGQCLNASGSHSI